MTDKPADLLTECQHDPPCGRCVSCALTDARETIRRMRAAVDGPEVDDFLAGVKREVVYQRATWGARHDQRKEPGDWLWTLGYLANKALHAQMAGDWIQAKHHTIASAALLMQWHEQLDEEESMR